MPKGFPNNKPERTFKLTVVGDRAPMDHWPAEAIAAFLGPVFRIMKQRREEKIREQSVTGR